MRRLYFTLCLLFFALSGFAEGELTVRGAVFDALTNQPINDATIKICNAADSSFVKMTISDHGSGEMRDGKPTDNFTYTGGFWVDLDRKKYILSVSRVGYETTYVNLDLTTLSKREYGTTIPTVLPDARVEKA